MSWAGLSDSRKGIADGHRPLGPLRARPAGCCRRALWRLRGAPRRHVEAVRGGVLRARHHVDVGNVVHPVWACFGFPEAVGDLHRRLRAAGPECKGFRSPLAGRWTDLRALAGIADRRGSRRAWRSRLARAGDPRNEGSAGRRLYPAGEPVAPSPRDGGSRVPPPGGGYLPCQRTMHPHSRGLALPCRWQRAPCSRAPRGSWRCAPSTQPPQLHRLSGDLRGGAVLSVESTFRPRVIVEPACARHRILIQRRTHGPRIAVVHSAYRRFFEGGYA